MRTSERAYHQIRWDARLDPARFTMVIEVHRPEPKRMPLLAFIPGGDLPWHRVLAIELEGRAVWDRSGTDCLDELAAQGQALPRPLALPGWKERAPVRWLAQEWQPARDTPADAPSGCTVLTWNVLWDRYDPEKLDSSRRWPLLLERILASDADLVALQEVTPSVHALIATHPGIRAEWWMSHPPGHPDVGDADLLLLGRIGVHQVALRPMGPHKALLAAATQVGVVITTHLTSDHSAGAEKTREGQLEVLAQTAMSIAGPLVVMGDFNCKEERDLVEAVDAWTAQHPPSPTFDPTLNPLAALATLTGKPGRLDRIYVRGMHAHGAQLLGTEPQGVWLSDHFGVMASLHTHPPAGVCRRSPSARSALAWVVDTPELEAVRSVHDPSFHRWPAHVNVLFGFVEEAHLAEAAPFLEAAQTGFETELRETLSFEHSHTSSHGLVPTDSAPWLALHGPLRRSFPRCGRADFKPHLTFARGPTAPAVPAVRAWVDQLAVLTRRAAEPFAVRARVGNGRVEFCPEPIWPLGHPAPAAAFTGLPGAVLVGSRALGCALGGADVDLVWPDRVAEDVEAMLRPLVDALIPVKKAGMRGFRAWKDGLVIDAQPGGEDPRVQSAIDDLEVLRKAVGGRLSAFQNLTRQVKGWARAQALEQAAWAGVEGLAWAVMVARVVRDGGGLHDFFSHYAAWDRTEAIGLNATEDAVEGFTVLTPSDGRPITLRADSDRVEACLYAAWEALDGGAAPEDLLRPFSFHQRYAHALRIVPFDRISAGYARGQGCAFLAATRAQRCPGSETFFGVEDGEAALESAREWAEALPGVEVEVVPTCEVPSPYRAPSAWHTPVQG